MRWSRWALIAAMGMLPASRLHAHEGPPFPIVLDRSVGPYLVSVWTDPDIGTGTFFVIVTPKPGTALPDELQVEVCVKPGGDRLPEACFSSVRQNVNDKAQYYAEVGFDRQEVWQVRVRLMGPGAVEELLSEVEATPPGYGRWDLLIYGFPFILFGLLWLYSALRRRSQRT